jgi:hypothetical protein
VHRFVKEPDMKNPENEVKEIEYVSEREDANKMLNEGWIYLGYYKTRVVHVLGEDAVEVPVFILGRS